MRLRWVVAALACAGVVVWMFTLLRDNVEYLEPVSEAVTDRADGKTRVGGSVVPNTIVEGAAGGVRFDLTEGGAVMHVQFDGSPPDLFEECAPVVVRGEWDGDRFLAEQLLIRHGEEYEPPSDDPRYACDEDAA